MSTLKSSSEQLTDYENEDFKDILDAVDLQLSQLNIGDVGVERSEILRKKLRKIAEMFCKKIRPHIVQVFGSRDSDGIIQEIHQVLTRGGSSVQQRGGSSASLVAGVVGRGRGHLPHLPLRGRPRPAAHLALLLRRLPALRAPGLPAAVDQELRHSLLRALQVPLHHAHQDQAVHQMGEAGDVAHGAAEGAVFHHLPRGGHNVRGVVAVRADRAHGRGDAVRGARVALLDKADRGGHRLHGRPRLHVRPVQDVRAALPPVARLQPGHLRAERPRQQALVRRPGNGRRARRRGRPVPQLLQRRAGRGARQQRRAAVDGRGQQAARRGRAEERRASRRADDRQLRGRDDRWCTDHPGGWCWTAVPCWGCQVPLRQQRWYDY